MQNDISVKNIKEYLDNYIVSQEQAKVAASVLVYNKLCNVRENMVFIGPSGCGKTQIFRTLREQYPNIYIYDISGTSSDGWSGEKKSYSVFLDMLTLGWRIDQIENSIIVFDEFDKICQPAISSSGENVNRHVQGELLSMVEGTDVSVGKEGRGVIINTRNISFVFLGAFEELYKKRAMEENRRPFGFTEGQKPDIKPINVQDLIDYGMRSELAGRIANIITMDKLNKDDYIKLTMSPGSSPIARLAKQYNRPVHISKEYITEIADEAMNFPTGARYIFTKIQHDIDMEIFNPGATNGKLIIGDINSGQLPRT